MLALAGLSPGGEGVPDRVRKHFVSDSYTVTWGATRALDAGVTVEIGHGNGHGFSANFKFDPKPGDVPAGGDQAHDEAVRLLKRHNVLITRDSNIPGNPVSSISIGHDKADQIKGVGELTKRLGVFTSLKRLYVHNTDLGDADVVAISLPNLNFLWIKNARITDAALKVIGKMPMLRELRLDGTKIRGSSLSDLASLPRLESLTMSGSPIDDKGLAAVCTFRTLRCLELEDTKITDAGLATLASLKKLTVLNLAGAPIGDGGLKSIGKVTTLKNLDLSYTKTTDAGLLHLAELRNLNEFRAFATRVTDDGIAGLSRQIPKCKMFWLTIK
jgi:Leucine-rich repeat (LRR) protein